MAGGSAVAQDSDPECVLPPAGSSQISVPPLPPVLAAGQNPGERVCHRRHPGHADELHPLGVLLGHRGPESWVQAVLRQERQLGLR